MSEKCKKIPYIYIYICELTKICYESLHFLKINIKLILINKITYTVINSRNISITKVHQLRDESASSNNTLWHKFEIFVLFFLSFKVYNIISNISNIKCFKMIIHVLITKVISEWYRTLLLSIRKYSLDRTKNVSIMS